MVNNVQFVLFFEDGVVYNPTKISSNIMEKFPELGNPIILPINTNIPKEANVPFMVFNQNNKAQVVSNFNSISITLKDENIDKLENIIDAIFDTFKKNEILFIRVGYLPSLIFDKETLDKFRKKYLNLDTFNDVTDFQFSWFKNLKFDNVKINCWERNISDSANFSGLLKEFDFNTKIDDKKLIIDKKFIKNFISFCNLYIEERK